MALTSQRAAFFDVDNTLVRGSTLYFLGRGMYQRGFFTKADISRFVVANIRFRMTGTEKQEVIAKFQKAAQDFIGGHSVTEIKKIGEEIYDEFVSPKIWQGTVEIAKSHLNQGEEVWLVTAAPQDMANIISQRLGFTGALGSKAHIENGIYTGSLDGKLLHGSEKIDEDGFIKTDSDNDYCPSESGSDYDSESVTESASEENESEDEYQDEYQDEYGDDDYGED